MDAELVSLSSVAATTVVTLLATDAWERATSALGALWRRVHPDRAGAVEADLADARAELLAARAATDAPTRPVGPAGATERALVDEWRVRIGRLLAADPDVAAELCRVLDTDLLPALPAGSGVWTGDVRMTAHAEGNARIYQVGQGTQHITER
ncbi:MAG TPA: hypothetical protein VFX70_05325 [Mycobacteriales bacterium]|nr:hypothetical protein [Mycobacteriales bacterium]